MSVRGPLRRMRVHWDHSKGAAAEDWQAALISATGLMQWWPAKKTAECLVLNWCLEMHWRFLEDYQQLSKSI